MAPGERAIERHFYISINVAWASRVPPTQTAASAHFLFQDTNQSTLPATKPHHRSTSKTRGVFGRLTGWIKPPPPLPPNTQKLLKVQFTNVKSSSLCSSSLSSPLCFWLIDRNLLLWLTLKLTSCADLGAAKCQVRQVYFQIYTNHNNTDYLFACFKSTGFKERV